MNAEEKNRLKNIYYASDEWAQTKAKIIVRDGCRCRVCNQGLGLQVHRRTVLRDDRVENDMDLITLCEYCWHAVKRHIKKRKRFLDFSEKLKSGVVPIDN